MWQQSLEYLNKLPFGLELLKSLTEEIAGLLPTTKVSIWQLKDSKIKLQTANWQQPNHADHAENQFVEADGLVLNCIEQIQLIIAKNSPDDLILPNYDVAKVKQCAIFPWVNSGKIMAIVTITANDVELSFNKIEQIQSLLINLTDIGQRSWVKLSNYDKNQLIWQGAGCSPGMALGTGFVVKPIVDLNEVTLQPLTDLAAEINALSDAVNSVKQDMLSLSNILSDKLSTDKLDIIKAYLQMMDRHGLMRDIVECMRSKNLEAKSALKIVINDTLEKFTKIKDPYLRARAVDIRDIGQRVLAYLQCKSKAQMIYPDNAILVGEEITMLDIAESPLDKLAAIVSVKGSKYSHASIFARSLGLPLVMGAKQLSIDKCADEIVFVDGYCGQVLASPNVDQLLKIKQKIDSNNGLITQMASLRSKPAKTSDDYAVSLFVNIGGADLQTALASSAEGVGLFRSEVSFMSFGQFPGFESQKVFYRKLLKALSPKPVIIRTLDIGGDKQLDYFNYQEENPYLGWRGLRFCLSHPEIFQDQLHAMIAASEGLSNLHIMLPMVSNLHEVKMANKYIKNAFELCKNKGLDVKMPAVGIMLEVPAATMQIKSFAKMVDFFSVGSNDLVQYMLAVDRNNDKVSNLFDSFNPAILQVLQKTVDDAHNSHKHISICGELAADPMGALLLVAMGFDTLSMSATGLDKVKWTLGKFSLANCQQLLNKALLCDDSDSVLALLRQAFKENDLGQLAGFLEF